MKPAEYDLYKDSGVGWLGDIPTHWLVVPIRYIAKVQTGNTPSKVTESYYSEEGFPWVKPDELNEFRGIFTSKQKLTEKGVLESRLVPKGSVLVCCIGTIGKIGIAGCDLSTNQQINSLTFLRDINRDYGKYVVFSARVEHERLANGNVVKILNGDTQKSIKLPIPSKGEQKQIASFLDQKTTHIDEAIAIKEQQIALLKERKQIIIQKAVTQGLKPNVPMKDSGVEWVGEIPEHWNVKKAKYVFDEIDERSKTGQEELLSVSHMTGVTPRSEKNVSMFMAEDYTGSKLCRKNDLVINIMWAWMGALGVSDRTGIVSPSYGVFRQKVIDLFNPVYLEYLFKSNKYVEYYNKVSTGLHSSRLRFYGHMLFAMKIGYPSFEEQSDIVDHLTVQTTRIDIAVQAQKEQIEKLKEYKTTLINSAVTGKIKVTDLV